MNFTLNYWFKHIPQPASSNNLPNAFIFTDARSDGYTTSGDGAGVGGVSDPNAGGDDDQTLVITLLHANEINIRGIVATANTHGNSHLDGKINITNRINAYGTVENNLRLHDVNYPTATYLHSVTKQGSTVGSGATYYSTKNTNDVVLGYGTGLNTEGSDFFITVVDSIPQGELLYVSIWGGQTDLAQALFDVKATRSVGDYQIFIDKLRIHDIADQDRIFTNIIADHPTLTDYLLNTSVVPNNSASIALRGIYWGGDETLVTPAYVTANIRGHGALSEAPIFPNVYSMNSSLSAYGGIKNSDASGVYQMFSKGLSDLSNPSHGSWAGRYLKEAGNNYYTGASDALGVDAVDAPRATVWRWRPDFSDNILNRFRWCVNTFANATHEPVPVLNGDTTLDVLTATVDIGDTINLDATGTTNPDSNAMSYEWFVYTDAGTYDTDITIPNNTNITTSFVVPDIGSSGDKTIHVILRVKNLGTIPMTAYRRFILTVNSAPITIPTPIHTWNMDGNLLDSSGSVNMTNTNVTFGAGKFGNGAVFNGTNAFATHGISQNVDVEFAISMYIRADNLVGGLKILFGHASYPTLGIDGDVLFASNTNATVHTARMDVPLTVGVIYHIGVNFQRGNRKPTIYVDGVLQTTAHDDYWSSTPSIGGKTTPNSFFTGLIDHIEYFDQHLTSAQWNVLANRITP